MESALGSVCRTRVSVLPIVLGLLAATDGIAQISPSYANCDVEEMPLTPAVERAFDLERLRAFLAEQATVEGRAGGSDDDTTPSQGGVIGIELSFELGEFRYYRVGTDECDDTVRAPVFVRARVGNDLLLFESDGLVTKRLNWPSALLQFSSDLASAAGRYQTDIETARIHTGRIDLSMYASPGQLRGDLHAVVYYFDDEAQLQRRLAGDFLSYSERQRLVGLSFPDDECEDHQLPFELDEAIESLDGRSADEARSLTVSLIGAAWAVPADRHAQLDPGQGSWTPIDCIAFPIGSKSDTDDCRYGQ